MKINYTFPRGGGRGLKTLLHSNENPTLKPDQINPSISSVLKSSNENIQDIPVESSSPSPSPSPSPSHEISSTLEDPPSTFAHDRSESQIRNKLQSEDFTGPLGTPTPSYGKSFSMKEETHSPFLQKNSESAKKKNSDSFEVGVEVGVEVEIEDEGGKEV